MRSIKKRILFLAPYPVNKAPSQRLKYEQYYTYFEKAGYQLTTHSFVNERFWKVIYLRGHLVQKVLFTLMGYFKSIQNLFSIYKYDLVYVHLWVTPLGPPIFEWLVRKLSKKIIYDIDDLIYLGNTSQSNSFIKWLKGRNKPIYLMKSADHVIVCTPKLEEFALKFNSKVTDISSTIDTDIYIPVNNYSNNKRIVLGWSGSHSTSKYLYLLEDILKKIYQNTSFSLLVIGDSKFNIQGIPIEAHEWSAVNEVELLQRIDIGLYPLPDEEWVYGKSGLKALQYMALGIPTIATKIGANYRIIDDGKSGFLVKSDKDWTEKIELLIRDAKLRQKLGSEGRKKVEQFYSIKANAPTYLKVLDNLIAL